MPVSVAQFLDRLRESDLVSPEVLDAIAARLPKNKRWQDAEPLMRELVDAKTLTHYQCALLVEDRARSLVLGDYVILSEIGAGGMGQVFQARHRRLKRIVAIKVLSAAFTQNEAAIKRFQREMEAAAKLTHPNIVAAFDAREQNGIHYLVMEYVAGHDLSKTVKDQGPLSPERAVDYVIQVAHGLAHAHREGVVHRDIKPANLLLDTGGRVKILDMGIARFDDQFISGGPDALTKTGSLMGTASYMAPEQALDVRRADGRADIYSLGCTLFYLLLGRDMYQANTYIEQVVAHREEPIPSLSALRSDVPSELDAIFCRMVAKRASERFQSMDEVHTALTGLGYAKPAPILMPLSRTPSASEPAASPPVAPVAKSPLPQAPPTPRPADPVQLSPKPASVDEPREPVHHGTAVFKATDYTTNEPGHTTWVEAAVVAQPVAAAAVPVPSNTRAEPQTLSDAQDKKSASSASGSRRSAQAGSPDLLQGRGQRNRRSKLLAVVLGLAAVAATALGVGMIAWGDKWRELYKELETANRLENVRPEPEVTPLVNPEVKPEIKPPETVPEPLPSHIPPDKPLPEKPLPEKPTTDPEPEKLAKTARDGAVTPRKAWQTTADGLPEPLHPPAALEAESKWLAAEDAVQATQFSAATKLYSDAERLFVQACEEGGKTTSLLGEAQAELAKLDGKRKEWQKVSQGVAASKLPKSASAAEQALSLAQESVRQLATLPLAMGRISGAVKLFEDSIASVLRERELELAAARNKAQMASLNAEKLLEESSESLKAVYARFLPAVGWFDKGRAAVKEGDALAAGDHVAALVRYAEGEIAAGNLAEWLRQAAEPVAEVERLRKTVVSRTATLPDSKLNLYAWPNSRLDAALALVLEADPRPALTAAKQVEAVLAQVDESVKKRPLMPRREAVGSFAGVATRRETADEHLRLGRIAEADRLYREAQDLYPRLSAPFDARAVQRIQTEWSAALGTKVLESNRLGMKFALLPPGEFDQGSASEEFKKLIESDPDLKIDAFKNELPRRRVRISRPFRLALHETTQGEFEQVLGRNPSWGNPARLKVKDASRYPVENVSWFEAVEFCNGLSKREGLPEYYVIERTQDGAPANVRVLDAAGVGYRLPTEAEWEYACRAGTTSFYHFGGTLTGRAANIDGDYPVGTTALGPYLQRSTEVGSYQPNAFGLYDMHGNVWEWCADGFETYPAAVASVPLENPLGGVDQKLRVLRGGSWVNYARNARSAVRLGSVPEARDLHIGFRVARTE